MTITFKEPSPKRFQTNRSKGSGAVLAWKGGEITEVFSGTEKNPQDLPCLNNPKLFFNHSLEIGWDLRYDSCSVP